MTAAIQLNNSTEFAGLGTAAYTVTTAGPYTLAFTSTLPYIAAGMPGGSEVTTGGSSLSVDLKQGSTVLLTVSSPSPTQKVTSGSVRILGAVGDVLSVVLTSSAAVDNTLNAIKTTINLYQGE